MIGPVVEVRRHQSKGASIQLPWERTRTRPSCWQAICERNAGNCREEAMIAAQFEGLPDRIASLESLSEK